MNTNFKYLVLLALLVLSQEAQSQSDYEIGLTVMPELNYGILGNQNTLSINATSSIGYGVLVGACVSKITKSKIDYQIGLLYRFRALKFSINNIRFQPAFVSEANILYDNTQLQHLIIPINLILDLSQKGNLIVGANFEVLINENRVRRTLDDEGRELLIGLESEFDNIPISINLGYNHKITNDLSMSTILNFGFSKIGLPIIRPSSESQISLQLGINYKI